MQAHIQLVHITEGSEKFRRFHHVEYIELNESSVADIFTKVNEKRLNAFSLSLCYNELYI